MSSSDQASQNAWKRRIGGDPWKNAIMLECEAECDSLSTPLSDPTTLTKHEPFNPIGRIDLATTAFHYERIGLVANAFVESYMVVQTGRCFLVGPTAAAVEEVSRRDIHFDRLNIVILNWHPGHVAGLQGLLQSYSEGESTKVAIWTSHWIWEEIVRNPCIKGWDPHNLRLFDGREKDYGKSQDNSKVEVGVGLDLSYSLSTLPFLRAKFRCNHQSIVIDPALDHRSLTLDTYVTGIGSAYLAKAAEFPQFSAEILSRYADVAAEVQRFNPEPLQDTVRCAGDGPVDLSPRDQDFRALRFPREPNARIKIFTTPLRSTDVMEFNETEASDLISDDVGLMILCGGLMNRVDRELIDPGYELDVPIGKVGAVGTERMSILEWRLRELDQCVAQHSEVGNVPVILLTTPGTEDVVDECCSQYRRTLRKAERESHLKIDRVAAQLIPQVKRTSDGKVTWLTGREGEWKLCPRGHMDALRVLAKEKKRGGLLGDRKFVVIFAFNNLGDVINRDTWRNMRRVRDVGAQLGIEVFQYSKLDGDSDKRWEQLSYCQEPSNPVLFKKSYGTALPFASPGYYSSLTCYVNLARLPDADVLENALQGLGFASSPENGGSIRQDLDMITHLPEFTVCGICDVSHVVPNSLYHYSRYLGVRTQDHVRHDQFKEKFRKHPPLDSQTSPMQSEVSVLIAEPRYQEYVWGGVDIATLKGLPQSYRDRRIAETWEISSHESGRSSVLLNADEMIPLDKVPGAIGYMAKYLDCHKALSVQVHPNAQTGCFLKSKGFPVRDASGKEESFFVLKKAPGTRVHLFMGFERRKLRVVANKIRQQTDRVAQTEGEALGIILENLCDSLLKAVRDECLEAIRRALFQDPEHMERLAKALDAREKDTRPEILEVFRYHLGLPLASNSLQGTDGTRILGKEYLVAAIGIVNLIRNLADFIDREIEARTQEIKRLAGEDGWGTPGTGECNSDRGASCKRELDAFVERAQYLFGSKYRDGDLFQVSEVGDHPLLKFFHPVEVADNSWIRIPSGTLHAWQGGGNFLIELGETSDNTFRILDYGREFSDNAREMHYLEAMYALNPVGFFDAASERRLISEPHDAQSDSSKDSCHKLLDCQFFSGAHEGFFSVGDSIDISFVMNPDGDVTLSTTIEGNARSRLVMGRCHTAIVLPNKIVTVIPKEKDTRVLYFASRVPKAPVVCFCLGGTRWEVGVWQDQSYPPVTWHSPMIYGDSTPLERMDSLIKKAQEVLGTDREGLRVGVSWPGFIDHDIQPERRFSSLLDDEQCADLVDEVKQRLSTRDVHFLSDFQAGLLGEVQHPLGRLQGDSPGMVINIGRGICVAFYHPRIKSRDMFHNRSVTACSGVGRWLEVNLKTGEFRRRVNPKDKGDAKITELVFPTQYIEDYHDEWVRASKYFSAAGIVHRYRSDVGKTFEQQLDQLIKEQRPGAPRDVWTLHRDLRDVWAGLRIDQHQAVAQFADDMAGLVTEVHNMIEQMDALPTMSDSSGEDSKDELLKCFRHIVLTGQVGQYFGLIEGGQSERKEGSNDLLSQLLRKRLDSIYLGDPHVVWRSDIGVAAERETEGFVYYLDC